MKPATAEYFARRQKSRDGLCAYCKQCKAECDAKWRNANRERKREYDRAYRAANKPAIAEQRRAKYAANVEAERARSREWAAANREKKAEADRAYREANKERIRARDRAYYAANKDRAKEYRRKNADRIRLHVRRRRALQGNAEGSHTDRDVKRQHSAQKGRCYWCGKKVGKVYHVDHIVPLSRGGSDSPENLVIACPHCNVSKRNRLPHEWPEGGRLL